MGVGDEGSVDDVGESAFESAECFGGSVAIGASSGQERSGVGVEAGLGDRDAVYRGVELTVPGA